MYDSLLCRKYTPIIANTIVIMTNSGIIVEITIQIIPFNRSGWDVETCFFHFLLKSQWTEDRAVEKPYREDAVLKCSEGLFVPALREGKYKMLKVELDSTFKKNYLIVYSQVYYLYASYY